MRLESLLPNSPVDHQLIGLSSAAGAQIADPASESGAASYAPGRHQKPVTKANRSVSMTVLGVVSWDIVPSRGSR